MTAYRLTGSRCRCPACSDLFNSVSVFDRHRVGPWTDRGIHRRCLTRAEMTERGWSVSPAGFWIERRRLDQPPIGSDQQPPAPPARGRTSRGSRRAVEVGSKGPALVRMEAGS
jgi:hypothetical protein